MHFGRGAPQAGTYTVVGGQVNNSGSIAIGAGSEAGDRQPTDEGQSVAIGAEADATGSRGIAIGKKAKATFVQGIAIGENAETTSSLGLAIGASAKAHYSAIALGLQANASEFYSLAFGNNSTASGKNSIAFGKEAQATESQSIALGFKSSSLKDGSISIGSSANASHYDSIAFGSSAQALGNRSIALGFQSSASNAGSLSIGSSSEASYENGVALGRYAKAQATYGVALGADSVANRASGQTGYVPSVGKITSTSTPTWKSTLGAVSVGSGTEGSEKTRQIIHVAAGSEDTDAVNMAQLKASQTKLELESNLLTKTESKTADGITYTLGIDASKFPKTDIVAGKGVSVSKTDPTKPIVFLNDDQDFSGTVAASKFKVGSSASLDTTGLNLIGTSTVTLKDSNPSPEKKTVLSTEGISVSSTTSPLGTHLTADGLYILPNVSLTKTGLVLGTGNPSVTTSGIKAGNKKITDLADGSDESDAVNVKQLKNARTTISVPTDGNIEQPTLTETNNGFNYSLSLKQDVNFNQVTTGNLVIGEAGSLVFGTAGARLTNTGLELGGLNGPKFTTNGISAGGQQIKNVQAGTEGTDAVNVQQMEAHVKANTAKVVAGNDGIKVDAASDSENGTTYTVSLNEEHTFTKLTTETVKANKVQIGDAGPSMSAKGIRMATQKITGLADGADDGDAVNVKQLKKSKTELQLASDETNLALENPAQEDDNGKHYVLRLNRDVNFDKVTTGNLVIGETGSLVFGTAGARLTNTGLEFGGLNGPKFTTSGISAGGQQIKNVRAGTEGTDAVNVQQMEAHVKANKSSVVSDDVRISVTPEEDSVNGGKKYKLSLNSDISLDSVKTGNATLSSDGLQITGGPSVTTTGIDAGSKEITNVARATTGTSAVNLDQMNEEIKKNKSSVAAGRGISVAISDDVEHGGKKYTVSLNENIEFTEVKTGDTTISSNGVSIAGGPSMTKDNGINAGNKVITNVADGVNATDAVNVSQLNSRLNQSKVTVKAKENGNITVEQSAQTDNGTEYTVSLNDSVSVNEVHVAQNVHLSSEGVRVGNSGPVIAENGIDAANRTISNVAPGVRATDAVNVAQLNTAVNNVFRQVHSVEKDAQAGIAMAIATAGLPQAYLPGKSMMAISGGTYRGQSGYAFGFSHVTDNGRYVIKASGSGNSQGHYGASVGMGWQW